MLIKVKPLSVNDVWQGRRFKTKDYKIYELLVLSLLRGSKLEIKENDKVMFDIEFGLSSKTADIDNPVKPFLDILQKKYKFNDKQIYEMRLRKTDVQKGQEYINFNYKTF